MTILSREWEDVASIPGRLLWSVLLKASFLSTTFLVIYLCILFTYRLWFHPLRKYPGPRFGSLTAWYIAYFAARGVYHRRILAWHENYGPIVRVGPNQLSFNTHESYVDIYAVGANNSKTSGYSALSASRVKQNLLSVQDKNIAKLKRRVYSRIFSPQGLKRIEPRLLGQIDMFVSSLVALPASKEIDIGHHWNEPVNLAERSIWLTHDVITELAFSKSSDMQTSTQHRHFPHMIKFMTWRAIICIVQPQFYKLKLDRIILATSMKQIMQLGKYAWQSMQERLISTDEELDDLYGAMKAASNVKIADQFQEKDYWVETLLTMGAGVIASGPTLSTVFFFLVHTPRALERITHEVRTRFQSVHDIRAGPGLNECNYLRACVDETMRLVPGVATMLPRVIERGGMVIAGDYYPEGAIVGCSSYALHRNPFYFHKPDIFLPERWISGNDLLPANMRKAFFPFGHGPRSCSGVHLALAELYIVVARAAFMYDMRLAPDAPCCQSSPSGRCTDRQFKSYVGLDLDGPMVQFRAREKHQS